MYESRNALEFAYAVAEMAASPGSVKLFKDAWIEGNGRVKPATQP